MLDTKHWKFILLCVVGSFWLYQSTSGHAQPTSLPSTRPHPSASSETTGHKLTLTDLEFLMRCTASRIHAYTRKELFTQLPQQTKVRIQNHDFGMFRGGFQSILHYLEILGCIARNKGLSLRYNYDQHLQSLSALAGIPIFAPQQQAQRWSHHTNYYNPAWIRWARKHLIPQQDSILQIPVQKLYDTVFQRFVRVTAFAYQYLQKDPQAQKLRKILHNLPWKQKIRIRDHWYNTLDDGHGPRTKDEASYYYHLGHAILFWSRRDHDGTLPEVWLTFHTILQRFDPTYLQALQTQSLAHVQQKYHTKPKKVYVLTPQQANQLQLLLHNAGSDDVIQLHPGTYAFTQALVIRNKNFLTLEGVGSGDVHITLSDPYTDVLSIERSSHIKIRKIRAKHSVQDVVCKGSVISIRNSQNIRIENNELNGSGSIGVFVTNSSQITIENNHIHSNSFAGIYLSRAHQINILRNLVEKNSAALQSYNSSISINHNIFRNNGK